MTTFFDWIHDSKLNLVVDYFGDNQLTTVVGN